MRVPTDTKCSKCNEEFMQDINGSLHCKCGVRNRWLKI